MAKRKSTTTKTNSTKKPKIDKHDVITKNDDSDVQNVESNEEKLDKFKKSFGMIKTAVDDTDWVSGDGYLVYNKGEKKGSTKIASFDLDDTLIVSKSGKKFAQSWDDWKFMLDEIPGKLKSLQNEGYKLVIFTNQGGIEKGKTTVKDFKRKVVSIAEKLGLNMQVFVSTTYANVCRKPNRGMFDLLVDQYNDGVEINLEESFFVGDAAGRPADWAPKKKKDFSCSDRLLALNCKIKFYTAEEYFLGQKEAHYEISSFNGKEAVANCSEMSITDVESGKLFSDLKDVLPGDSSELVLMMLVGPPASGKSTFAKDYLVPYGFNVVNRDTLNTWQKCVAVTKRFFEEKKNVVIDNTNTDVATRQRYLAVAAECGVKHVVCCIMDVSEEQCRHNEIFRELTDNSHSKVSEIVFRTFKSKYEQPTVKEKFSAIYKIVPALKFDNEDHKNLYARYL